MRFTAPAIGVALALATVSSVGLSRKPDVQVDARSVALVQQAKGEIAANRLDTAIDALESALAVDPRNREAFVTLAAVARKQQLTGKAIRYYREALLLEPNDLNILQAQGEALVEKGALGKAKENLARIEKLCVSSCAQQAVLAAAIKKGAEAPVVAAKSITPAPTVAPAPMPEKK